MPKQRLELTWIGKDVRPKLEPRILLEDPAKSYHAPHRVTDKDIFDNMLIHGDNLLALKALEQEFTGKVKCIYIDPPYNTGSAFEHYDDGVEHSLWLSLMRDRLEILYKLLSEDGSLWVNLDDNEAHYFKVMCDEVFGRKNFIANIVWQKAYTANQTARFISNTHDHIFCYSRDVERLKIGKFRRSQEQEEKFKNYDNDPRGPWKAENLSAGKFYSAGQFSIVGPTGVKFSPPPGRYWRCNEQQYQQWLDEGRITFGKAGTGRPMLKKFLSEMPSGLTPNTWWNHENFGSNKEASIDLKRLFSKEIFETPKPEKLIHRVLEIASNPGDLVLDSFLGSGTTAAVAHKMGRRWIGIELGEHCYTHCVPRLHKVINGEDPGGITEAVDWRGGGGFRFYELAPSLIKLDPWDIPVINPAFNAEMLAEAVCKMHGYRYAPSPDWFWMHGEGHKDSHIFVTTRTLTTEVLQYISDQVGEARSLLICCPPCPEAEAGRFPNLTLSIMPNALLKRYEWDHDDYSLNVKNLPRAEPQPSAPAARAVKTGRGKKAQGSGQISLLDIGQGDAQ